MSHPPATLTQERIRAVLIAVLQAAGQLAERGDYRLVGTAAAVLRGVDCPAADIDILVKTHADVDQFGAALAAFPCLDAPAWIAQSQQYYANYLVDGVEVGFSTVDIASDSDLIETFGPGPWQHYSLIACGPYRVPVVALELRLITELYRDRPDRYQPILSGLGQLGADLDLVGRGLAFIGLPPARQEEIMQLLRTTQPNNTGNAGNAGECNSPAGSARSTFVDQSPNPERSS